MSATYLYRYQALVRSVYDGDTITADVDLGMHVWIHNVKIRLARINAPEVRGTEREAGRAARDWLREKIQGQQIMIETKKDKKGKYGRYLAEIWYDGQNLNDTLVTVGHASYQDY